ncbi:uncharacterized protein BDV14DRAFT_199209 [Aspergillus stella-maris]|uniref:uncharacterized protein n=1 Tax=Aspergillus stella-maris TaxID=1810926 RepID=UPI003CCD6763
MTPLLTIVSFILTSLPLWICQCSAEVIGPDVSTIFNSDSLEHCLLNTTGLLSTSSAVLQSDVFPDKQSSPLTWTQAIRVTPDSISSQENDVMVHREFYFGYAPTGTSEDSTDTPIRACSLIFYDASALYGTSDLPDSVIDWSRELPGECVANLTTHLDDAARGASIETDDDLSTFCRNQGADLLDYYVDACEGRQYSVRFAEVKAFTTTPSQTGNCTLPNEDNYNFRQMASFELSTDNGTTSTKQLVQGSTPIITIIFPPSGSNETDPETHYVALRVEENLLPLVGGDENGGSRASKVTPGYFVMFSWVVGVLVAVWEYAC